MVSIVEVGGMGGEYFNFNGMDDGSLLQKIQVWQGDLWIKAVKVWLTDGRFKQFGVPDGNPQEFTFQDGEYFASLSLWPSQDGTHLGAIKFKTSIGNHFDVSATNGPQQEKVPVDVESGKCAGIQGRSASAIDRFGFILLKK